LLGARSTNREHLVAEIPQRLYGASLEGRIGCIHWSPLPSHWNTAYV